MIVAAGIGCVGIDLQISSSLDVRSEAVVHWLFGLLKHVNCVGLIASPPCNTFSALRFAKGGPPPLRTLSAPEGNCQAAELGSYFVRLTVACARRVLRLAEASPVLRGLPACRGFGELRGVTCVAARLFLTPSARKTAGRIGSNPNPN